MANNIDPVKTNPDLGRGGYHHRGKPGEEAAVRRHMRVSPHENTKAIDQSDPIKGGVTARSTARGVQVDQGSGPRDVFVLGRQDAELLESPVFHAGAGNDEEAVPVFRQREAALLYLQSADWQNDYEPVSLAPQALKDWLGTAHADGVKFVALDLNRQEHLRGQTQTVLPVAELVTRPATDIYTLIQEGR